jgi:multidrug efflux pump subunit AcrA (membrane-fusion protein)
MQRASPSVKCLPTNSKLIEEYKMKKRMFFLVVCTMVVFMLAGCKNNTAATTEPTPITATNSVVVEGHFVPRENLYLSFLSRGRVSEILVKQGDQVKQGQTLIRLGDSEQALAAVSTAKLELTSAQQAMDTLLRTAELNNAQTKLAYLNAQKARIDTQLIWDRLDQKSIQTSIDNAQETVDNRKADLDTAQQELDKVKDKPADDTERIDAEDKLKTAQTNYDDAVRLLLIQSNRLDIPRVNLDSAVVTATEAERTYNNSLDGPDKDKLALMQARLDNALAQVSAAQKALDNYGLKAPFNGIVADINVSLNQLVGPETWAIVVIDPAEWFVETSDLTEYEIVGIEVGDTANITVDALPGATLTGVVDRIDLAPKTQAGDIIYTVRLKVNEPDPKMKWGMTVEVTFP